MIAKALCVALPQLRLLLFLGLQCGEARHGGIESSVQGLMIARALSLTRLEVHLAEALNLLGQVDTRSVQLRSDKKK
jgi:hypothetical protein